MRGELGEGGDRDRIGGADGVDRSRRDGEWVTVLALHLDGFTPRASVTLAKSATTGSFGPSRGPCRGSYSWLGTQGLSVVANFTVDVNGHAAVPVTLPAPACGAFLSALDNSSCDFSDLGQVPWN